MELSCLKCIKKYILNGIETNNINQKWILNKCNLQLLIQQKIENMQKEYIKYFISYPKCRFCDINLISKIKTNNPVICNSIECIKKEKLICNIQFECGHYRIGLNKQCLPKNFDITDEDYCNIC